MFMTTEEINQILTLLNNNELEKLRYYIETKKIRNFSALRQAFFEDYLKKLPVSNKTILFNDLLEQRIIFSNGASLYYLNYNYVVLNSPILIRNNFCKIVGVEEIKKVEHSLNQFVSELIHAEFFTEQDKYIKVENTDETISASFNKLEIRTADEILSGPKYKLDAKNPLLYAESEVGKAYILGYRNKSKN